jgi:competence protein ComEA
MLRMLVAGVLALTASLALAAVNLNTATKDDLVALPGIGPAKAQAILDYRAQHGGFKSIEELKDVKGIGARRFEKLKADVVVAPLPRNPSREGKGAAGAREARATRDKPAAAGGGTIRTAAEAKARP